MTEKQEDTCNVTSCKEPVVYVSVSGIQTRVLIDSGSVSNLMEMSVYEELKTKDLNTEMEKCQIRFYGYGGRELEVIGQIKIEISVGDKKIDSHFVVTKRGRCILERDSSKALGVLAVNLNVM